MRYTTARESWTPTDLSVLKFPTCAQVNVQTAQQALANATAVELDAQIADLDTLVVRKRKELSDAIASQADALSERLKRRARCNCRQGRDPCTCMEGGSGV